ncbi:MAG: adenylate/guanylate cyclase domain-containing protein [Lentisphaeria bacterium]|nr:adenylate/guanylate cyclase domain-containing protein [Lentisphaeria bacterium]
MKSSMTIIKEINDILKINWERKKGTKVPDAEDIQLGNEAVCMEGAVLYADLRGSTELVQKYKDFFVADIYKSFLRATCEVIKNNSGVITSFDGDRVMAVFVGDAKCSDAARTGLQIHFIVTKINEKIKEVFPSTDYLINYAVGIDVSDLFIVRTGVRGANDLAWIGNAANVAAKLSEMLRKNDKTFITERIFVRLNEQSKFGGKNKECMWKNIGEAIAGESIFASSWIWKF